MRNLILIIVAGAITSACSVSSEDIEKCKNSTNYSADRCLHEISR